MPKHIDLAKIDAAMNERSVTRVADITQAVRHGAPKQQDLKRRTSGEPGKNRLRDLPESIPVSKR